MTSDTPISVLIPVHHTETPAHLDTALASIFDQTHLPAEVVVVQDNTEPAPKLNAVIERWKDTNPDILQTIPIDMDHTLGGALQSGLKQCSNNFVARMDSDDIARPSRLERQLKFISTHPNVDAVGSYIAEFDKDPEQPHGTRTVPCKPEILERKAQFRCPMNHPSVLFRKSAVLAVGGYSDRSTVEDYDLWARLLTNGSTLANIPEVLVDVRADQSLYRRRGGFIYAKREFLFQRELLSMGFISLPIFCFNLMLRLPLRFLPNSIRESLYSAYLRN